MPSSDKRSPLLDELEKLLVVRSPDGTTGYIWPPGPDPLTGAGSYTLAQSFGDIAAVYRALSNAYLAGKLPTAAQDDSAWVKSAIAKLNAALGWPQAGVYAQNWPKSIPARQLWEIGQVVNDMHDAVYYRGGGGEDGANPPP